MVENSDVAALMYGTGPDTVLVFPPRKARNEKPWYLYLHSTDPVSMPPVLARLLQSDGQESKWRTQAPWIGLADALEDDDSDAQSDDDESAFRRDVSATASQSGRSMRYIVMRGHAYKTYLAVLNYLNTGKITFSIIRSSVLWCSAKPVDDMAASPRSVYRLATFLELPQLQVRSLQLGVG